MKPRIGVTTRRTRGYWVGSKLNPDTAILPDIQLWNLFCQLLWNRWGRCTHRDAKFSHHEWYTYTMGSGCPSSGRTNCRTSQTISQGKARRTDESMNSRRSRDVDTWANQGRLKDIGAQDNSTEGLDTGQTAEIQAPFAASPNFKMQSATPTDHELAICHRERVKKTLSVHDTTHE